MFNYLFSYLNDLKGGFSMKFLFFYMIFGSFVVQAQPLAYYTYLKAKKPIKKQIQFEELKAYYDLIKKSSFNPPTPQRMFKDYLRFKMGVEVALNEKLLVKNPNIAKDITNPYLKAAFFESLYKHLAELKLKKQMFKLNKKSIKLSKKAIRKLYAKNPEFHVFWIAINHSVNPNAKQINEARKRANQVYNQVKNSKKKFLELIMLYSDDKRNGALNINRSKASIPPKAFAQLKKMKKGEISKPVRSPYGYLILKLNKKIPFAEVKVANIKANYFNEKRVQLFNNYFNRLKKDFKVKIVKAKLINKL